MKFPQPTPPSLLQLPLLLLMTTLMMTQLHVTSATHLCTSRGSGCRAPFGLDLAFETLLSTACHRHSICYSCGANKASLTKEDCDQALRREMYAACQPLQEPSSCLFQADNVWALQTHVVGTNYFHPARLPAAWCVEHGIEDCLPMAATTTTTTTAATTIAGGSIGRR